MTNKLLDITLEERALVDIKRLPTQARIITQLIGIEDAWLFLNQYGGLDYRFPIGKSLDTQLHQILPYASATLLIANFGGQKMSVPKPDKIIIQVRNHRIFQARNNGNSSAHLAKQFNLSRRNIILVCNAMSKQLTKPNLKSNLNND